MSKYRYTWDENKYQKYLNEGRGQGIGREYKPWITIHDFPSMGFSLRQPSWKSNRVCHFLSRNELRMFYLLEWSDNVTDIREQYPMDLSDTMDIAQTLGIKHPADNKSKAPYVMTSDFMITLNIDGEETQIVRTVKPFIDLEKKNTIEHFEIERRYWKEKKIDWGIVTEKEMPKTFVLNIEWAYYSYNLESENNETIGELLYYGELLKDKLEKDEGKIVHVAGRFDNEMCLEPGTSLNLIKHLIARKEIILDMITMPCTECSTDSIKQIIRKNDRLVAI